MELFVNGVSLGKQSPTDPNTSSGSSWAEWQNVNWSPGNVTAHALDLAGNVLTTATRFTSGEPVKLELRIDVPSRLTGTGEALVLDGHDGGMVRASILDGQGQVFNALNALFDSDADFCLA